VCNIPQLPADFFISQMGSDIDDSLMETRNKKKTKKTKSTENQMKPFMTELYFCAVVAKESASGTF
jgi:hypothetical protein